ncbi:methyl-accepting chemotaxis protein [Nitrospirillum sp. BR 11828]|uniref:methyl-accepting chemotaxis protein n=1 Tax=Nitrospirillum sp. BR 11828 TaxID=3104325 RepID=UPI002ACAC938|nr:methyl-accepting chemotaxis protein [Nitrospirillum sp. BR 11828]MDZ5649957.1 methyl-accepting chemotaxis protein [Nitrospirillum sp. BR 11828]
MSVSSHRQETFFAPDLSERLRGRLADLVAAARANWRDAAGSADARDAAAAALAAHWRAVLGGGSASADLVAAWDKAGLDAGDLARSMAVLLEAAAAPAPAHGFFHRHDAGGEVAAVARRLSADLGDLLAALAQRDREAQTALIDSMVGNIERNANDSVDSLVYFTDDLARSVRDLNVVCTQVEQSTEGARAASADTLTAAQTVSSAAEELHASIAEINHQVGGAQGSVDAVVTETERTKTVIDSLGEAAHEIGGILTIIQDIAAQTNLLALNATIEAARAGEAGKGFAVVASEVKSLANQSAHAAEDIAAKVAGMRAVSLSAAEAVDTVRGAVGTLSAINASIAAAVEQQTAATQEIARTVSLVADSANRVSALMQDVHQVTQSATTIARVVDGSAHRMREGLETLPPLLSRAIRTSAEAVDRRQERRRPAYIETTVSGPAGEVHGLVRDLSETGLFVECDLMVSPGALLSVPLGAGNPTVQGTVVARTHTGVHLRLDVPLDTALVNRLAEEGARLMSHLAIDDHHAFIDKVTAAVANGGGLMAADLSTHHSCRLGRWYDSVSDRATRDLHAYVDMAEPHVTVHQEGRKALLALAQGDKLTAERHVAAMAAASAKVIGALEALPVEFSRSVHQTAD